MQDDKTMVKIEEQLLSDGLLYHLTKIPRTKILGFNKRKVKLLAITVNW
jgi:hypothetical protein